MKSKSTKGKGVKNNPELQALSESEDKFFSENKNIRIQQGELANQVGEFVKAHPEKVPALADQAASARPILDSKVVTLIEDFLETKRQHGSKVEQDLYKNMTTDEFVDRLLTKRPVMFMGNDDQRLLRGDARSNGDFNTIGKDNEKGPLVLKDYISYDEMQISALVGVSSETFFINNGSRTNSAKPGESGKFEEQGVYTGLVGARFERGQGFNEYPHMVITKSQNTKENGYGQDGADNPILNVYAKHYKQGADNKPYFPSFEEVEAAVKAGDKKYQQLPDGSYFNVDVYKERMKASIAPFLIDANNRAEEAGKPAYVHAVGLGLGVWAEINGKKCDDVLGKLQVEVYHELMRDMKLTNISNLDFSWFPNGSKQHWEELNKNNPIPNLETDFSKRNPADKLTGANQNKLLVAQYAWDGNSLPGNEFWQGMLSASGDPAAIASSLTGALHNSQINTRYVNGQNAHICSQQDASISKIQVKGEEVVQQASISAPSQAVAANQSVTQTAPQPSAPAPSPSPALAQDATPNAVTQKLEQDGKVSSRDMANALFKLHGQVRGVNQEANSYNITFDSGNGRTFSVDLDAKSAAEIFKDLDEGKQNKTQGSILVNSVAAKLENSPSSIVINNPVAKGDALDLSGSMREQLGLTQGKAIITASELNGAALNKILARAIDEGKDAFRIEDPRNRNNQMDLVVDKESQAFKDLSARVAQDAQGDKTKTLATLQNLSKNEDAKGLFNNIVRVSENKGIGLNKDAANAVDEKFRDHMLDTKQLDLTDGPKSAPKPGKNPITRTDTAIAMGVIFAVATIALVVAAVFTGGAALVVAAAVTTGVASVGIGVGGMIARAGEGKAEEKVRKAPQGQVKGETTQKSQEQTKEVATPVPTVAAPDTSLDSSLPKPPPPLTKEQTAAVSGDLPPAPPPLTEVEVKAATREVSVEEAFGKMQTDMQKANTNLEGLESQKDWQKTLEPMGATSDRQASMGAHRQVDLSKFATSIEEAKPAEIGGQQSITTDHVKKLQQQNAHKISHGSEGPGGRV